MEDLTGRVFGEWTVLSYAGPSPARQQMWNCECSCGGKAMVQGGNLKSGVSKRCKSCRNRLAAKARWTKFKEAKVKE